MFRTDIEGLRAVAILSVIIYHAELIGNGFIGVDIFFVISGYLIGGQLYREFLSTGKITLLKFAVRRFRRLMPNAIVVILVSLGLGLFLLPEPDWRNLFVDISASIINIANFVFADRSVGYFSQGVEDNPLMHFWSLSIEEQFYLGLPLTIFLSAWLLGKRGISGVIYLIVIASLFGCLVYGQNTPTESFYLTQYRIWELGIGVIAAIHEDKIRYLIQGFHGVLSLFSLLILIVSACYITEWQPWPGWMTLIPVIATATTIIASAHGTWAHRLLSLPFMQWTGARSYSIYLWHWPALIYGDILFGYEPIAWFPSLVISIILANFAYKYIELPVRQSYMPLKRPAKSVGLALTAMILVISVSFVSVHVMRAMYPERVKRGQLLEESRASRSVIEKERCFSSIFYMADISECIFGDTGSAKQVAIIGDSHGMHLFDGLEPAVEEMGYRLETHLMSACPPFLVRRYYHAVGGYYNECYKFMENSLRILKNDPPEILIISFDQSYNHVLDDNGDRAGEAGKYIYRDALIDLIREFNSLGTEVVLVPDIPKVQKDYRSCIGRGKDTCSFPFPESIRDNPDRLVARKYQDEVHVISLDEKVCPSGICYTFRDGVVTYRDKTHMTAEFSRSLKSYWYHNLKEITQIDNEKTASN